MTACTATLGDSEGLACLRVDEHVAGHVFAASSGSWLPDRHDEHSGGEH